MTDIPLIVAPCDYCQKLCGPGHEGGQSGVLFDDGELVVWHFDCMQADPWVPDHVKQSSLENRERLRDVRAVLEERRG